ncbi:MAG: hypothetical protein ACLFS8_02505 [Clostridia bacterium]
MMIKAVIDAAHRGMPNEARSVEGESAETEHEWLQVLTRVLKDEQPKPTTGEDDLEAICAMLGICVADVESPGPVLRAMPAGEDARPQTMANGEEDFASLLSRIGDALLNRSGGTQADEVVPSGAYEEDTVPIVDDGAKTGEATGRGPKASPQPGQESGDPLMALKHGSRAGIETKYDVEETVSEDGGRIDDSAGAKGNKGEAIASRILETGRVAADDADIGNASDRSPQGDPKASSQRKGNLAPGETTTEEFPQLDPSTTLQSGPRDPSAVSREGAATVKHWHPGPEMSEGRTTERSDRSSITMRISGADESSPVAVRLAAEGSRLTGSIRSPNAELQSLMASQSQRLQRDLQETGFGEVDIGFGAGGGPGDAWQNPGDGWSHPEILPAKKPDLGTPPKKAPVSQRGLSTGQLDLLV